MEKEEATTKVSATTNTGTLVGGVVGDHTSFHSGDGGAGLKLVEDHLKEVQRDLANAKDDVTRLKVDKERMVSSNLDLVSANSELRRSLTTANTALQSKKTDLARARMHSRELSRIMAVECGGNYKANKTLFKATFKTAATESELRSMRYFCGIEREKTKKSLLRQLEVSATLSGATTYGSSASACFGIEKNSDIVQTAAGSGTPTKEATSSVALTEPMDFLTQAASGYAPAAQTLPPHIADRRRPFAAVPGAHSSTGHPMTATIGFRSQLAPGSGATMAPLMTDFSSSQMPVHLAGAGMTVRRSLPFPVTAMSGVHSVSGRRRLTETSTRGTHAAVSGALPSLTAAHSAASHPMVGTSVSQFTATIAPLLAAGSLPVPVSEVSGVHSAAQLVSDRRHLGAAAIVGCRQLPLATGSRSGHCMDATTATVQDSMPLRKRRRVHAHGSAAAQSRVSWKPVARCGAGTSTSSSTCAVPKKRAAAFGSVESEVKESDDWQPALNISPLLFTKRSGEYVVIHKVDGEMVSLQKEDGTHAVVRKSELRPWEW